MNNNFSFIRESVNNQTVSETLSILSYETGDMHKCCVYSSRYPKDRNAYQPELKKATAQAISMLRMFCEQQKWDFEEVAAFGEHDYVDKMNDIRKCGLQEHLRQRELNGD